MASSRPHTGIPRGWCMNACMAWWLGGEAGGGSYFIYTPYHGLSVLSMGTGRAALSRCPSNHSPATHITQVHHAEVYMVALHINTLLSILNSPKESTVRSKSQGSERVMTEKQEKWDKNVGRNSTSFNNIR